MVLNRLKFYSNKLYSSVIKSKGYLAHIQQTILYSWYSVWDKYKVVLSIGYAKILENILQDPLIRALILSFWLFTMFNNWYAISKMYQYYTECLQKELEDTKGVIRIRKSKKNREHNYQKKKYKRTNTDLQNIHRKLKIE